MPRREKNRKGLSRGLFDFPLPAQIFIIQLLAFLPALFLLESAHRLLAWSPSILASAIVQGFIAALITWLRKMPRWLLPVQILLPTAMLLLLALQIAPVWYLLGFMILLLVFWGALFKRVPLYLSGKPVWDEVLRLIPEGNGSKILDLGSGLGGPALYFADRRPDLVVEGVEISPFLWMVSHVRKRITKSPARFRLKNYENMHFGEYDVVFAYLSPVVMDSLWKKAKNEMKEGSLFLSYEFEIADADPQIQLAIGKKVLYGWRI